MEERIIWKLLKQHELKEVALFRIKIFLGEQQEYISLEVEQ